MPGERLGVGTEALSRIKYVVNHAGISKVRAVQRGSLGGFKVLVKVVLETKKLKTDLIDFDINNDGHSINFKMSWRST